MKRNVILIVLVLLLVWLMWQLPGAHAQGNPPPTPPPTEPPITQGDVDALKQKAAGARSDLNTARVILNQAQFNYGTAQALVAQTDADVINAEQQLKIQQTAEAVKAATQARERADRAHVILEAAARDLQTARDWVEKAEARVNELEADLVNAHFEIEKRDATIAEQGRTIERQNNEIETYRQYREQTNTLIALLALDLIVASIVALMIVRQLQVSKRIRYEAIPAPSAARPIDEPTDFPNSEAVAQQLDNLARQRTVAP